VATYNDIQKTSNDDNRMQKHDLCFEQQLTIYSIPCYYILLSCPEMDDFSILLDSLGLQGNLGVCSKCNKPTDHHSVKVHDKESQNGYMKLTCRECTNIHWYVCLTCKARLAKKHYMIDKHFDTPKHREMCLQTTQITKQAVMNSGVVTLESQDHVTNQMEEESTLSNIMEPREETLPWVESDYLKSLKQIYFYVGERQDQDFFNAFPLTYYGQHNAMFLYHAAESSAKRHGGVSFLVSVAFECGEFYSEISDLQEVFWQFRCFVQYISMTENQRARQAGILNCNSVNQTLCQKTWVPEQGKLNQIFGSSNRNTIWNNLPIPPVENISGIAYTSPGNVLRYLMANSIEMDSFTLLEDEEVLDAKYHVTQSKFAKEWKKEVKTKIESGSLTFKFPDALLIWFCDWRDGFGANRTKQNRKSTVAWTVTFAPIRSRINTVDNTRLVALGLKNNAHWKEVEQRFEQDVRKFGNGLEPFEVYHGQLKRVIPIFVRRFVCLTDKVERADYTSTISCTSTYHRLFGQIIQLDNAPPPDTPAVQAYLKNMKGGLSDKRLKQYDWSSSMLKGNSSGAVFPACSICRKNNVDWLRSKVSDRLEMIVLCENCANWKVNEKTNSRLKFVAPKDYPSQPMTMPNCPEGVAAPLGREPIPLEWEGKDYLVPIKTDFQTLKDATRFAFFNAMSPKRQGWNQTVTFSYLRTFGVNAAEQALIYSAATKAYSEGTVIDWNDDYFVGSYRFPAAWVAGLQIPNYIELLMHLVFLGLASSCFQLSCVYFVALKQETKFKEKSNQLLQVLMKFNLSWLLVYPFGGKKLTTGAWVSENWLAWVRVSKICFAYCAQNGIEDQRNGCNDVIRMVTCFSAMTASIMSRAGCSQTSIRLVDALVREFLSTVRELDVRVYSAGKESKTSSCKTWIKSNFASLVNLVSTMETLGPLTNFWDGGGKGEKYIQLVKVHIPRGARDGLKFHVRVQERVYKWDCISLIEKSMADVDKPINHQDENADADEDSLNDSVESDNVSLVDDFRDLEGMVVDVVEEEVELVHLVDLEEPDEKEEDEEDEGEWVTPMETAQMEKARVYYVYKNLERLTEATNNKEPIAGVLVFKGGKQGEFYALYRVRKSKLLSWKKGVFDDGQGLTMCGTWYSPLIGLEDTVLLEPIENKQVHCVADLAAVAIPLKYGIRDGCMLEHLDKYCVITNTWRERNHLGNYELPTISFEDYEDFNEDDSEDEYEYDENDLDSDPEEIGPDVIAIDQEELDALSSDD
jgi:hypothetical protein